MPSSGAVSGLFRQLSTVFWLEREGTVASGTPVLLEITACPSASGGHQENVFGIQTSVMALPQKPDTLLCSWQHKARAKAPVQPTVATLCSEVSEEHACLLSDSSSVFPLLASSPL